MRMNTTVAVVGLWLDNWEMLAERYKGIPTIVGVSAVMYCALCPVPHYSLLHCTAIRLL